MAVGRQARDRTSLGASVPPPHPVISALPSSRTRFTAELLTGFPARYWGRTVLRVDSTSLQPLKPSPHQGEGPPPPVSPDGGSTQFFHFS